MQRPVRFLLLASLLLLGACVRGDRTALRVERDTVGDTIVVRTFVGSRWGDDARLEPEIRIGAVEGEDGYLLGDVRGLAVAPSGAVYVHDAQVPALRRYGPEGAFVATLGRAGAGPGEYRMSDGGLAVLPDGRVVLRDPGNARFTVYDSAGDYLETWPFRDGVLVVRPLYVDTAGSVYTQIWARGPDGGRHPSLLQLAPDGTRQDSILSPDWGFEEASVAFSTSEPMMVGGLPIATIVTPVPFTPRAHWTFSPLRWMIGGVSTEYTVDVFGSDGTVLRIQREMEPVPVVPHESDAYRMGVIHDFRRVAPDWQWNGPPIPKDKPPFKNVAAGRDGRILGAAPPARIPFRRGRPVGPLLNRPMGRARGLGRVRTRRDIPGPGASTRRIPDRPGPRLRRRARVGRPGRRSGRPVRSPVPHRSRRGLSRGQKLSYP